MIWEVCGERPDWNQESCIYQLAFTMKAKAHVVTTRSLFFFFINPPPPPPPPSFLLFFFFFSFFSFFFLLLFFLQGSVYIRLDPGLCFAVGPTLSSVYSVWRRKYVSCPLTYITKPVYRRRYFTFRSVLFDEDKKKQHCVWPLRHGRARKAALGCCNQKDVRQFPWPPWTNGYAFSITGVRLVKLTKTLHTSRIDSLWTHT